MYEDNAFVTLTYDDEHLPKTMEERATLDPLDLQNWLKRLRKAVAPTRIRFYAVGEYGDETFRPHYHAIIFNLPSCRYGQTRAHLKGGCCGSCELVRGTWEFGKIYLGTVEESSAQYVCGYVTKKMTRTDDPRLEGRWPEFSRMSLKPGIGADFMHEFASSFLQFNLDETQGDVPVTLRHGRRELPLGRYLRMKARKYIGRDEKTPAEVLETIAEEMRPLRETAFNDSRAFKEVIKEDQVQAVANFNSRRKLKSKKGGL